MAKAKKSGSAAQRRAQERQQVQRRDEMRRETRASGGPSKGPKMRKKDRSGLYMVIGVLALIVAIIIGFVLIRSAPTAQKASPADPTIVAQLTGVTQATWEGIAAGGVTNSFKTTSGQALLKGPGGHPEVFYVGGEYCPFCAAERWTMINALSRFGTFSNLSQVAAYEYNISTFSFYGSKYTSQYVDFVPVEVNGNEYQNGTTPPYVALQNLTASQQANFDKYNAAPYFSQSAAFPFVNVGNQYLQQGSAYSPQLLLDSTANPLSWHTIADSLTDSKSKIAQAILGSANYLTASICTLTNQQPSSVCSSTVIQQMEQSLKKTSNVANSAAQSHVLADYVAAQRKRAL